MVARSWRGRATTPNPNRKEPNVGLFKRKKPARSDREQPEQKPCTCDSTWTDRQRQAFGDLPVKFRDCPRHG